MRKEKALVCDQCGKTFSMPAHLARHKSATHNVRPKKGGRKASRKVSSAVGAKRPGRPPAVVTRFGLANMVLDDLATLIKAARQEAERRLQEYREMLTK